MAFQISAISAQILGDFGAGFGGAAGKTPHLDVRMDGSARPRPISAQGSAHLRLQNTLFERGAYIAKRAGLQRA